MGTAFLRSAISAVVVTLLLFQPNNIQAQIAFQQGNAQRGSDSIQFDDVVLARQDDSPPACDAPGKRQGFCKPLAQCAIFYAEIPSLLERPCETRNGQRGVCCPSDNPNSKPSQPQIPGVGSNGVLTPPPQPQVVLPRISRKELENIAEKSVRKFQERLDKITDLLFNKKVTVPKGSPAASHQRFFTTTNSVLDAGNKAQLSIETSQNIANDLSLTPEQRTFGLPQITARGTQVENTCPPVSQCNPSYPYRTMDGSCNNRQNPDWGKSKTAFQRILPSKYGDGINSPRTQKNGQLLPSARLISERYFTDENRPYNNLTLMVMQWGQFLDHDLTHTPIVKGNNSVGISCCQNGQPLPPNLRHPDCFPIEIPANDQFYRLHGQRCMEFVRSLPAPRKECNFGPREQMNQITGYIDGSNVYGSSINRARSLREGVGGRLLMQRRRRGADLLPANKNECSNPSGDKFCFRAGDLRVNEQLELAVMHTLFLREHNRIARLLEQLNPSWSDEILYQETRRIVIAELEHITYNEFLPLVLGPEYMRTFELQPKQAGYTRLYNPSIDPSITNAFATAAYRFGHSMVQGLIQSFSQFGSARSVSFVRTQFQPFEVYDNMDDLVRGLTNQQSQRFDHFASEAITNHLFEGQSSGFGLDLMAINIQRGRDHGLPPYNEWREVCGLPRIRSWQDLASVMDPASARTLSQLYPSVDEIDLFVGGLGEKPQPGSVLGPTFVCIVGDQFSRLRRGDRFFYEETSARFTEAQLNQLRKVSLARIICDNSDDISVIQPLVFQQASFLNQRQPCNSDVIPKIDLRFWTERRRTPSRQPQK